MRSRCERQRGGAIAVVDAIERRDPERARRAIERHLDGSNEGMTEALLKGEIRAVTV